MTVSELITELLKMPMNAVVTIETDDDCETDIKGVRTVGVSPPYVYLTPAVPVTLTGGVFA